MAEYVIQAQRKQTAAKSAASGATAASQQKRTEPDIRASLAAGPPRKQVKLAGNLAARLFGVQTGPAGNQPQGVQESAHAQARRLLQEYKDHCASLFTNLEDVSDFMTAYPHIKIHKWWAANRQRFPVMAQVARSVLCITASSGNLERDFCHVRDVVTIRRSSLSPWMVEMLLLTHALHGDPSRRLTPDDIPSLTPQEAEDERPPRVTKKDLAAALADFDVEDDEGAPEVSTVARLAPWMSLADLVQAWDADAEDMDVIEDNA